MPRYKVTAYQTSLSSAVIVVEATDPETAQKAAEQKVARGDVFWRCDGDQEATYDVEFVADDPMTVGQALEKAYPWGYRSDQSEP